MAEKQEATLLIEQYKRCSEDWRHFDKLLWQIPFSTLVATTSLLTLTYAWIKEVVIKELLLGSLLIFVLVMMILAIKIRFFQDVRTEFAKEIEKKMSATCMPIETSESLNYLAKIGKPKSPIYKILRAFYFQLIIYVLLLSFILYLLLTMLASSPN